MEGQLSELQAFLMKMQDRLDAQFVDVMDTIQANTSALLDLCGKPPTTSASSPAPPPSSPSRAPRDADPVVFVASTDANSPEAVSFSILTTSSDECDIEVANSTTSAAAPSAPSQDADPSIQSGVDRLSRLPDSLLRDIIGRLPVKDAARTAVLSRRWNPISGTSAVLHLGDLGFRFHGIERPVPSKLVNRPLDAEFVVTTNGLAEQTLTSCGISFATNRTVRAPAYDTAHSILSGAHSISGGSVLLQPASIREAARTRPADLRTGVGTMLKASSLVTTASTSTPSLEVILGFQFGVSKLPIISPTRCSMQGHGSDEVTTLSLYAFSMTAVAIKGTLHHEGNTSELLKSSWPPPTQDECKRDGIDTWLVHWLSLECSNGIGLLVPQPWPPPCVILCSMMICRITDQLGCNYCQFSIESNTNTEESMYLMRNWKPPWVFARVFRIWVLLVSPMSLLHPPDTSTSSYWSCMDSSYILIFDPGIVMSMKLLDNSRDTLNGSYALLLKSEGINFLVCLVSTLSLSDYSKKSMLTLAIARMLTTAPSVFDHFSISPVLSVGLDKFCFSTSLCDAHDVFEVTPHASYTFSCDFCKSVELCFYYFSEIGNNLFNNSRTNHWPSSKTTEPLWLLCFGKMQVIGGFLLEVSQLCREYVVLVQLKTTRLPPEQLKMVSRDASMQLLVCPLFFCSTEQQSKLLLLPMIFLCNPQVLLMHSNLQPCVLVLDDLSKENLLEHLMVVYKKIRVEQFVDADRNYYYGSVNNELQMHIYRDLVIVTGHIPNTDTTTQGLDMGLLCIYRMGKGATDSSILEHTGYMFIIIHMSCMTSYTLMAHSVTYMGSRLRIIALFNLWIQFQLWLTSPALLFCSFFFIRDYCDHWQAETIVYLWNWMPPNVLDKCSIHNSSLHWFRFQLCFAPYAVLENKIHQDLLADGTSCKLVFHIYVQLPETQTIVQYQHGLMMSNDDWPDTHVPWDPAMQQILLLQNNEAKVQGSRSGQYPCYPKQLNGAWCHGKSILSIQSVRVTWDYSGSDSVMVSEKELSVRIVDLLSARVALSLICQEDVLAIFLPYNDKFRISLAFHQELLSFDNISFSDLWEVALWISLQGHTVYTENVRACDWVKSSFGERSNYELFKQLLGSEQATHIQCQFQFQTFLVWLQQIFCGVLWSNIKVQQVSLWDPGDRLGDKPNFKGGRMSGYCSILQIGPNQVRMAWTDPLQAHGGPARRVAASYKDRAAATEGGVEGPKSEIGGGERRLQSRRASARG